MQTSEFIPSVHINSVGVHIHDLGPNQKPRRFSSPLSKPDKEFLLAVQDAMAKGYLMVKIEYEDAILPFQDSRVPKIPALGDDPVMNFVSSYKRFSRSAFSTTKMGNPMVDPNAVDDTGYRPLNPILADVPVLKIFTGNLPHKKGGAFETLKEMKGASLMPWDDASRPILAIKEETSMLGFGTTTEKEVMLAAYTNAIGFKGKDALMIAQILYQVGEAQKADGVPEDRRVFVQGFDMAQQVEHISGLIRTNKISI